MRIKRVPVIGYVDHFVTLFFPIFSDPKSFELKLWKRCPCFHSFFVESLRCKEIAGLLGELLAFKRHSVDEFGIDLLCFHNSSFQIPNAIGIIISSGLLEFQTHGQNLVPQSVKIVAGDKLGRTFVGRSVLDLVSVGVHIVRSILAIAAISALRVEIIEKVASCSRGNKNN